MLELPPDESNAASVFTQDLAVVVNGIALMCRPSSYGEGKSASQVRQVEVDTMRAVLKKELNQTIVDPPWTNNALLSGSDVLFTGREFFVGLSDHTNMEGALAVASTWPEYPCTPIKVRYQLSQQVLDRNLAKNLLISRKAKKKNSAKFVYILAKQCRSPFNLTNFRGFEIFTTFLNFFVKKVRHIEVRSALLS